MGLEPPAVLSWDRATDHFLGYLPASIAHWVVMLERPAQARIADALSSRLGSSEFQMLGEMPPEQVLAAAREYFVREDVGVIEFIIKDGSSLYNGMSYHAALTEFSYWSCRRVKLCLDVWDDNFPLLFAEHPQVLAERCIGVRKALMGEPVLTCSSGNPTSSEVTLDCTGCAWTAYTGFEDFDYVLPTGETACLPRSVDGVLELDGWIVGTLPFGLKYGRIRRGDLVVHLEKRQIRKVTGANRLLRGDFETALERLPGLGSVAEVGVGQSLAVSQAAGVPAAGYLWHERHYGVHLGLGAELPEMFDPDQRATSHHLDLVLAAGTLTGKGGVLLKW